MRTYHYTPTVKVYLAAVGKDSETYYDVSEDIQTCVVNRKTNAPSDGNIILLNKGNKYNGLFSPFDKIVVFTSKGGEPIRLLTGYITKVQLWTLYEDSMRIYFSDTLYRLNCLYFDPGLSESKKTMGASQIGWSFGEQIYSILKNICGWPENMIDISREIPSAVQDWARKLYVAQKSDYEQTEQITKEMFQEIMSSSVAIGGMAGGGGAGWGSGVNGTATGNDNAERVWTFFVSLGFTKESAFGILANVQAESFFDNTASSYKGSGHYSIGLFQTTDTTLYSYASEHGMEWTDPQCQCECVMSALEQDFEVFTGRPVHYYSTGEWVWWPTKVTLQDFSKITDVGLAAEMFCRVHERPNARGAAERRRRIAENIYARYTSTGTIGAVE